MRAEHYIAELLYRYHCVVVPEFGAFLTQTKSAEIHSDSNTIYPPSKSVSFNQQLSKNDGLLVSHMAEVSHTSYEEMLEEVSLIVKDWNKRLKNGDAIELFGIGKLSHNTDGRVLFEPENKINYLTSSFGLSSFVASPVKRQILKEEVEELEERIPFIITPEKREESSFRPLLKYAAVVLLALSTGFTAYRFYNQNLVNQEVARQDADQQVSKYIQEATFFDSQPIELPAFNITIKKVEKGSHHVIAGAFRVRKNADKKIAALKKKGYNAVHVGTNKYGLHQIAYASFENPKEALAFLKQVRRSESSDAWLLSEK
ncbi:MAG: SPOR domain-containing protein [Allomuricauda sp.]|nr:MAG: SPOR domain-containing protein [Allomuricauda sp.]